MSDYNSYVNSVNKIFEHINLMKTKWNNPDNLSYLSKIEDYKDVVIEVSKKIKSMPKSSNNVEALSDDK